MNANSGKNNMGIIIRKIATCAVLCVGLLMASSVRAESNAETPNHYFFGANGIAMQVYGGDKTQNAAGGGGFVGFNVIENLLDLEIVGHLVRTNGVSELPLELLAKVPFRVNSWFHPFVGIGPSVVPVLGKGKVYAGVATTVGSYFWLAKNAGLSLELNDNLVFGSGKTLYKVGGTAGIVIGF